MLTLSQIRILDDQDTQDLFQEIKDKVNANYFFTGQFRLMEIEVDAAVTNNRVPHRLGFRPTDLIQTWKTGTSTVTFNYDEFDREFIDITTSGAVRVRFLVGRFKE